MASTFLSAVTELIATDNRFVAAFPGGLHYDAAPADPSIEYPYVVFAQTGSDRVGIVGRRNWVEKPSLTFHVYASGDQDVDVLADTLASILFSPRGQGLFEVPFSRGRIVHRRGGVAMVGLSRAMGVGGVDVFQATIESTWLVARDS